MYNTADTSVKSVQEQLCATLITFLSSLLKSSNIMYKTTYISVECS